MNAALEDPSVWNDPKKAQELGKEKKGLEAVVMVLDQVTQQLADNTELFEMSREEGDFDGLAAIEASWIPEIAGHLLKRQYLDPHWEKKAGEVIADVSRYNTLSPGDVVWLGTDEVPMALKPGDSIEIAT